jgi:phage protein D
VTFLDIDQSKQSKIKSELLSLEVLSDLKTGDTLEVDRGHKGKLVEKIVYERQKHIFPYKNWKIVSGSLMIRLFSSIRPWITRRTRSWTVETPLINFIA